MCADSHVTCCVVLHNSHVTFVLEHLSDDSQLSCEYVTLCIVSCDSRLSVCGGGWKSYLCSSVQTSHCRPGTNIQYTTNIHQNANPTAI